MNSAWEFAVVKRETTLAARIANVTRTMRRVGFDKDGTPGGGAIAYRLSRRFPEEILMTREDRASTTGKAARRTPRRSSCSHAVLAERGIDADGRAARGASRTSRPRSSRFPGSPTIRVDGRDVDPQGARGAAGADLPHLSSARRPRVAGPEPRATGGSTADEPCPRRTGPVVHACPASTGSAHSLDDYARQRRARPDPVVQPLPVRARVGGTHDRDPARLRRPRRAARRGQLERREPVRRPTRSTRCAGGAEREGFNFDYLHDEDQSLARALGSERTPEVFVFDRDRRLVYHGAIDDSRDEDAVATHYLRDALDALLRGGEPPIGETHAGRVHRQVARVAPTSRSTGHGSRPISVFRARWDDRCPPRCGTPPSASLVLALCAPGPASAGTVVSTFYYPWFGTALERRRLRALGAGRPRAARTTSPRTTTRRSACTRRAARRCSTRRWPRSRAPGSTSSRSRGGGGARPRTSACRR